MNEFKGNEIFLEELRLLLRRDANGLYIMSTECTYDLSPLKLKSTGADRVFVSDYSTSAYSYEGKVTHGPARFDLPYYRIELAAFTREGPADTIYVEIGREVPPNWRLKL